jgi:predicted neutral ceramidase superfamily lipid hydrolase
MSDKPATLIHHVVGFVLGAAGSVWFAQVMTYWWLWFVVPLGLPAIGTAHAWALCAASVFFSRSLIFAVCERADVPQDRKTAAYVVMKPIVVALWATAVWGVLWCVQRLM